MKNSIINIMSFNVRVNCDTGTESWESRLDNLIKLINDSNPDLIGVQEAQHGPYTDMITNLCEYESVGKGRDDGKKTGEYAPIFYRKTRFTLIDTQTFWLSETPEKPSLGWDAMLNRICTYAVLLDNHTQKEFIHYNTHLDHIGQQAMLEGARLIKKTALDKKTPAVITGDFNVREDSETYKHMSQQGFCDAKYTAKSSMSYGTFHGYNPTEALLNESPIDYVFHTDNAFDVASYKVLINGDKGRFTSDHYPIIVSLSQR